MSMDREWAFDERRHAGQEHLDSGRAARYDEKAPFDPSDEIERMRSYGVGPDDVVCDFGAGTGTFALAAAAHCDRVIAVDVAEPMLAVLSTKAAERTIENVDPVSAGFVSYEHTGAPAAYVFSRNALHHLPDFWKVEALKTIADTLEPGGILRLRDLAYSFDPWRSKGAIDAWLAGMEETAFSTDELERHVREEYSTYTFLLAAMLERVGFELLEQTERDAMYAGFTCRWPPTRPD